MHRARGSLFDIWVNEDEVREGASLDMDCIVVICVCLCEGWVLCIHISSVYDQVCRHDLEKLLGLSACMEIRNTASQVPLGLLHDMQAFLGSGLIVLSGRQ